MTESRVDLENEPVFDLEGKQLQVGDKAPDLHFKIALGEVNLSLYSVLANGPVLLNFIKGTWCPFCQTYMARLNKWRAQVKNKSVSSIVISNESTESIRAWLRVHPVDFMFGSVKDHAAFTNWGVRISDQAFARPATFLIDASGRILLTHNLSRGSHWESTVGMMEQN